MKRPGLNGLNGKALKALARMYKRRKRRQRVPHIKQPGQYIAEHLALIENAALCDPQLPATPEEILLGRDDAAILYGALSALPPRAEQVLRWHYGLDGEPKTLRDIGALMGFTGTNARRVEQKAFRKLLSPSSKLLPLQDKYGARRKAHCNLYVPHWKRDEAEQTRRDIEALRVLAEEEVKQAKAREYASRIAAKNYLRARAAQAQADARQRYLRELNTPQAQQRFNEYVAHIYGKLGMLPPGVWR